MKKTIMEMFDEIEAGIENIKNNTESLRLDIASWREEIIRQDVAMAIEVANDIIGE